MRLYTYYRYLAKYLHNLRVFHNDGVRDSSLNPREKRGLEKEMATVEQRMRELATFGGFLHETGL